MIVTCPSCGTRFSMRDTQVADGKKVRCARCRHVWRLEAPSSDAASDWAADPIAADPIPADAPPTDPFMSEPELPPEPTSAIDFTQSASLDEIMAATARMPDPVEPLSDEEEETPPASFEDELAHAPELVRPAPSSFDRPASATEKRPKAIILGWSATAVLTLALIAILLFGRERITGFWPAAGSVYSLLGLKAAPAGSGLELKGVNTAMTDRNGTPVLLVAGEIANPSRAPRALPEMMVSLKDKQSIIVKSWRFSPHRDRLLPGETTPFQTALAAPPGEAVSATVTFVP